MEALFRQQYHALCRYVYRIVDHADDSIEVVQESFVRLYQARPVGRGEHDEVALLFRLARNLAIDVLRRRQTRENYQREAQVSNVVVLSPSPEELLLQQERQALAKVALGKLTEKQRDCLGLRSSGLSYQAIAATLAMNPESVGPTLARALRKFRTLYEELLETKPRQPGDAQPGRW